MDGPTRASSSRSLVVTPSDDEEVDSKLRAEGDVGEKQKVPKRRRATNDKGKGTEATESKPEATKKRAKATTHQRITERVELPRLWDPDQAPKDSYS
jgi:hypothetical protein